MIHTLVFFMKMQFILTPFLMTLNILSIKLDGSTKEDFAWGFRIGFLTYGGKGLTKEQYSALEQKTEGVIRATISNSNKLGQSLLIRALKSKTYSEEKSGNLKILKAKYEKVKELMELFGAGSARGWWSGGNRSQGRKCAGSGIRNTGEGRCRLSVRRMRS